MQDTNDIAQQAVDRLAAFVLGNPVGTASGISVSMDEASRKLIIDLGEVDSYLDRAAIMNAINKNIAPGVGYEETRRTGETTSSGMLIMVPEKDNAANLTKRILYNAVVEEVRNLLKNDDDNVAAVRDAMSYLFPAQRTAAQNVLGIQSPSAAIGA